MSAKKPLVVAIIGPTASGKTAAALYIARHIPAEIISVDSALIYRGMDIGTAKPSHAELTLAPHHLINILEPTQSYSAMQFRADALRLQEAIQARHKLVLLVGGTMLYFKALRDGLDTLPPADPALRAALDTQAEQIGAAGMHAKLAAYDPQTAQRLKPNDRQRIQRALEIIILSGQTMSSLLTDRATSTLPFALLPIALEPARRDMLHTRIAHRFDQMLEQGLINELENLRARGDLHLGLPSMRCVGYRQTWEYLDGQYSYQELRDKGMAATRQLAKRQLTWLRAIPDRIIHDCFDPQLNENVFETVRRALQNQK